MMNDMQVEQYFSQHNLSPEAREFIGHTRTHYSSRLIGTNAKSNVCVWHASQKMQRTIQAEGKTTEYGFAIEFEYSKDVIEFWDQPQPVSVLRRYSDKSQRLGSYTADYLVLYTDGPQVIEVKDKSDLEKLIKKKPLEWKRTGSEIIYKPAFDAFSNLGLIHKVRSTQELNPIRTANLRLLLEARRHPDQVTPDIRRAVSKVLDEYAWIRLSELAKKIGVQDHTPLLQMMDEGSICVAFSEELIAQPESTWVASSMEMLALARVSQNGGSLHGGSRITRSEASIQLVPGKSAAEAALKKLERIEQGGNGRSMRRWKKMISEARDKGLTGFQAIIDKRSGRSGNRMERINSVRKELLDEFIKSVYNQKTRMSAYRAYKIYKRIARWKHPKHPPISRNTFTRYIKANPEYGQRERGGRRAANAAASPSPVESRDLRATLPFELAAIDHYQADIKAKVVGAHDQEYAESPWITALIDLATDQILAEWIGFRRPSTRACAMVLRRCVRRHGRLPAAIIFDRGPEFMSVYFYSLLANYSISPVLRPAEHPRFGGNVERLFGLFKTQWLSLRPGNKVNFKEARSVSRTHAPDKNAVLTLEQLMTEFNHFVEWKNSSIWGVSSDSPSHLLKSKLAQFPCMGRKVQENMEFIIATAVDVRSYRVDPRRGIHIDLWYSDPELRLYKNYRRPTDVRIEPEDPYRIYVRFGGNWITCFATGAQKFLTKDSIAQLAESVRILDGKAARVKAKEDADQALIGHLLEADEHLSARKVLNAKPELNPEISVFSETRNVTLEPLEVSKWGDE